jgi:hypothetical protein
MLSSSRRFSTVFRSAPEVFCCLACLLNRLVSCHISSYVSLGRCWIACSVPLMNPFVWGLMSVDWAKFRPLLKMTIAAESRTLSVSTWSPGCCVPRRCLNFRFCLEVADACAAVHLSTITQSRYVSVETSSWCGWNSSLDTVSSPRVVWCILSSSRTKLARLRSLLEASVSI